MSTEVENPLSFSRATSHSLEPTQCAACRGQACRVLEIGAWRSTGGLKRATSTAALLMPRTNRP